MIHTNTGQQAVYKVAPTGGDMEGAVVYEVSMTNAKVGIVGMNEKAETHQRISERIGKTIAKEPTLCEGFFLVFPYLQFL